MFEVFVIYIHTNYLTYFTIAQVHTWLTKGKFTYLLVLSPFQKTFFKNYISPSFQSPLDYLVAGLNLAVRCSKLKVKFKVFSIQ